MCGIFGLWHTDHRPVCTDDVRRATASLRHRGPDDEGYLLVDTRRALHSLFGGSDTAPELRLPVFASQPDDFDLAFGFRRLSILDLSPTGHQPMGSPDGRLWIVFNGEIYNYLELREELKGLGHAFHTGTDTEVILATYAEWGEACLSRFNGMWAFALWDGRRGRLFCARDRFGIKPFYYRRDGGTFAFASEIKALLTLPGAPRRPNDARVFDFLTASLQDHTDETFFAGIRQLPPACFMTVRPDDARVSPYWDLRSASDSSDDRVGQAERFRALFEDSVRLHLRSDVTIGTCLSGGLDSSAIVCVANRLLTDERVVPPELVGERQKTFSSCFEDRRFDERHYIEQVLAHTGAEANYTFPSPERLLEVLPRLIWHQDEPFGSTSIFAQWCVMATVAERGVKVLLDGQGGDELLAGYPGYYDHYWGLLLGSGRWREWWHEMAIYRRLFGGSWLNLIARSTRPHLPEPVMQLARDLKHGRAPGLAPDFARQHRPYAPVSTGQRGDAFHDYLAAAFCRLSLPALLHYEDRNSMAHSVEARVPFLDYRLVEYAFSLPADRKINHGLTKAVLREALREDLPERVRLRTDKMGFVTPERIWMTGPLLDWALEIVRSASFRSRGYFDASAVERALLAQKRGERDLGFQAWRWISLELWMRRFIDG